MITINRDSWHWNLYVKWLKCTYGSSSIEEISICGYIGGLICVFTIVPIISLFDYIFDYIGEICPRAKIVDPVDEHDPTH